MTDQERNSKTNRRIKSRNKEIKICKELSFFSLTIDWSKKKKKFKIPEHSSICNFLSQVPRTFIDFNSTPAKSPRLQRIKRNDSCRGEIKQKNTKQEKVDNVHEDKNTASELPFRVSLEVQSLGSGPAKWTATFQGRKNVEVIWDIP